ncbi:MAG: ORF6N domain-containing protein [Verrucomicrobiales bacterium]|nr:ORF6N domain-containing protein [Verrucomicrobiales bacterium]
MDHESPTAPTEPIRICIRVFRGQRVMLDSDLAPIYGVALKRLNEQVKRNLSRFPEDFAFQLDRAEFANLKSQFATSSTHGGKRKLPWAFTEHGAIMLASVLNSPVAIEASVRVVRAFLSMREQLAASHELARKLIEVESHLAEHDEALKTLFAAIRRLIEPVTPPPAEARPRREIGFHVRDQRASSGHLRLRRRLRT